MKKLSLIFVLLFTASMSFGVSAVIGDGTSTTNGTSADPIERYYNYEHFQIVYTAAELTTAGMAGGSTISALGFSVSESAVSLANFSIDMGHTSQATADPYISTGLVNAVPAFTYEPIVQTAGNFDMITFTSNFVWNGSDNIVVNTCTGSNPYTSPYGGLRYTSATLGSMRYIRTDGSENCETDTDSNSANRPNIRFDFTAPTCPTPTVLTATNIAPTSVDLGWTESGSATTWEYVYGEAPFAEPTVAGNGTTSNPVGITGLTASTNYEWYVRANCGGGDYSLWVGSGSFTTLDACPLPTALTETNITTTAAGLNWTEAGSATTWEYVYGVTPVSEPTGSGTSTTTRPVNLTGLDSDTTYDWWVRAVCGVGDESGWVSSTFTTEFAYVTQTFPFSEDFESNLDIWNLEGNTTPEISTTQFHGGASSLSFNTTSSTNSSVTVQLGAGTNPMLTFWYYIDYYSYNDMTVDIKEVGASIWTNTIWQETTVYADNDTWLAAIVDLSSYNTSGVFQLRFNAENTSSSSDYIVYLDDISVVEVTCPDPNSLAASNITINSAAIDWTEAGTAGTWEYVYGVTPLAEPTGSGTSTTTKPVSLTGLTSNTTYDWWVRAVCGVEDESDWVSSSFTTLYDGIQIGSGTTINQYMPIDPYAGYSYSNTIYLDSEFGTPGADKRIEKIWYNYHFDSTLDADSDAWVVYMGTTANDALTDFIPIANLTEVFNGDVNLEDVTGDGWLEIVLTNPFAYNPATDGNLVIGVDENTTSYSQSTDDFYCDLDERANVSIEYHNDSTNPDPASPPTGTLKAYYPNTRFLFGDIPACLEPSDLTVSNIASLSADLGWTESNSPAATSWTIEWGESGFTPFEGEGNPIVGTESNPQSLIELTSNTAYDWYIQAICGSENSPWVGPNTFITECEAVALPISENVDTVTPTALPSCWSMLNDTGNASAYVRTQSLNSHSAPNSFTMYNNTVITDNLILISPESSSTTANTRVRFWAKASYGNNNLLVGTITDPTDPETFTLIQTIALNATYTEYTVNLSGTDSYVAMKHGLDATYDNNYIDDIIWEEIPSCLKPSDQTALNVTPTSADLGWTESGTAEYWNIEWGLAGFTQGLGLGTTTLYLNPTHALTDLDDATSYDWYVQADCGHEDLSTWTGPHTFSTLVTNDVCADAEIIGEVVDQVWDNTSATTSGVGTHTINKDIWYVYTASSTGLLDVDLCGSDFDTKLAVWDECGGTELGYDDDDCPDRSTSSMLEDIPVVSGEDYFIQVGAFSTNYGTGEMTISLEDCVDPSDQTEDNLSQNSVDLGWTENGGSTGWEIEYGLQGYTVEIGTSTAYTNPYTLTDLIADTAYDWYVRSDCGAGEYSAWVGPSTFTTLADFPAPSNLSATNIGFDQADLGWTEVGSATQWEVEYGLQGYTVENGTSTGYVSANPYTLIGLGIYTNYDFYVRAYDGISEVTAWAGPFTFSTTDGKAEDPTPADNATDIAKTATTLDWDDVVGAEGYKINIGTITGGTLVANHVDCSASEYTHTVDWLAYTEYFWTVYTVYNDGTIVVLTSRSNDLRKNNQNTDALLEIQGDEWSFTTAPDPISTFPWNEGFDTFLPDLWAEAGSGDPTTGPGNIGSADWYGGTFPGGDSDATLNLYSNNDQEWLISPEIDLGSTIDYQFEVDIAVTNTSTSGQEDMGSDDEVLLLISSDNGATNTTLDTWNAADNLLDSATHITIDLSSHTGVVRFAVWASDGTINDPEDYWFHVDNVQVREIPSCLEPSDLVTSSITTSGADLGWTSTDSFFDIYIVATGDPAPILESTPTVNDNPETSYTWTGGSTNTAYDWYVRTDCGEDNETVSIWTGPKTFTTACNAVSVFPFTEDFESGVISSCWSNLDDLWSIGSEANSGSYCAKVSYSHSSGDAILTVQSLNLPANHRISFWWKDDDIADVGTNDYTYFEISTDNGDSWTTLATLSAASAMSEYEEVVLDLSAYSGDGVLIRWKDVTNSSFSAYGTGLDDITIEEIPSLPLLEVDPDSHDFGTVYVNGTSGNQTFTISNAGVGTLTVNSISLTGSDNTEFTLTNGNTYPVDLTTNTITVDVSFDPTSTATANANLSVDWSIPDGDTRNGINVIKETVRIVNNTDTVEDVPLTGVGLIPDPGVVCGNPLSLTFPAVDITGVTGDYDDDYSSTYISPSSNYLNGDDVVYQFTTTEESVLSGTIITTDTYLGAFILTECPNITTPPTPTIQKTNSGTLLSFDDVLPAGTYYLIISSWPSPQSIDYTINLDVNPMGIPQDVSIAVDASGLSTVSWTAVTGADSYIVYGSDTPGESFVDITSSGSFDGTSWTSTATLGDIKFIKVSAVRDASDYSMPIPLSQEERMKLEAKISDKKQR
jgi:large repetitive protein